MSNTHGFLVRAVDFASTALFRVSFDDWFGHDVGCVWEECSSVRLSSRPDAAAPLAIDLQKKIWAWAYNAAHTSGS